MHYEGRDRYQYSSPGLPRPLVQYSFAVAAEVTHSHGDVISLKCTVPWAAPGAHPCAACPLPRTQSCYTVTPGSSSRVFPDKPCPDKPAPPLVCTQNSLAGLKTPRAGDDTMLPFWLTAQHSVLGTHPLCWVALHFEWQIQASALWDVICVSSLDSQGWSTVWLHFFLKSPIIYLNWEWEQSASLQPSFMGRACCSPMSLRGETPLFAHMPGQFCIAGWDTTLKQVSPDFHKSTQTPLELPEWMYNCFNLLFSLLHVDGCQGLGPL